MVNGAMAEKAWVNSWGRGKLLISWQPRKNRRVEEEDVPFYDMLTVTYLFQSNPIFKWYISL